MGKGTDLVNNNYPILGPFEEETEDMKCIYEGQYFKRKKTGFGKVFLQGGNYAEGVFKLNRPYGFQRMVDLKGNMFEGEIHKDDREIKIQGYLSSLQDKGYEEPGNRGIGVAFYDFGVKYEGAFKDGLRHGYGELHDLKGGVFKGFWSNDQLHGVVFFIDRDGRLFKQKWDHGKLLE